MLETTTTNLNCGQEVRSTSSCFHPKWFKSKGGKRMRRWTNQRQEKSPPWYQYSKSLLGRRFTAMFIKTQKVNKIFVTLLSCLILTDNLCSASATWYEYDTTNPCAKKTDYYYMNTSTGQVTSSATGNPYSSWFADTHPSIIGATYIPEGYYLGEVKFREQEDVITKDFSNHVVAYEKYCEKIEIKWWGGGSEIKFKIDHVKNTGDFSSDDTINPGSENLKVISVKVGFGSPSRWIAPYTTGPQMSIQHIEILYENLITGETVPQSCGDTNYLHSSGWYLYQESDGVMFTGIFGQIGLINNNNDGDGANIIYSIGGSAQCPGCSATSISSSTPPTLNHSTANQDNEINLTSLLTLATDSSNVWACGHIRYTITSGDTNIFKITEDDYQYNDPEYDSEYETIYLRTTNKCDPGTYTITIQVCLVSYPTICHDIAPVTGIITFSLGTATTGAFSITGTTELAPQEYDIMDLDTTPIVTFTGTNYTLSTCSATYSLTAELQNLNGSSPSTASLTGTGTFTTPSIKSFYINSATTADADWSGKIVTTETITNSSGVVLYTQTLEFFFKVTNRCGTLSISEISPLQDITTPVGIYAVANEAQFQLQRDGAAIPSGVDCGSISQSYSMDYSDYTSLINQQTTLDTANNVYFKAGTTPSTTWTSGYSLPFTEGVTVTVSIQHSKFPSTVFLSPTFKIFILNCIVSSLTGSAGPEVTRTDYLWDNDYAVSSYIANWVAHATYIQDLACGKTQEVVYDIKSIDPDSGAETPLTEAQQTALGFSFDSDTYTFTYQLTSIDYVGQYKIGVQHFVTNAEEPLTLYANDKFVLDFTIINSCLTATINPPDMSSQIPYPYEQQLRAPQSADISYDDPTITCPSEASGCQCGNVQCIIITGDSGIDPGLRQNSLHSLVEFPAAAALTRTFKLYAYDNSFLQFEPMKVKFQCYFQDFTENSSKFESELQIQYTPCLTGITVTPSSIYTTEFPDRVQMPAVTTSSVYELTVEQVPNFCNYELQIDSWTGIGTDEQGNPSTFAQGSNTISVIGTSSPYQVQFDSTSANDIGLYNILFTFILVPDTIQSPNTFSDPDTSNQIVLDVTNASCFGTSIIDQRLPELIIFDIQNTRTMYLIPPFADVVSQNFDPAKPYLYCSKQAAKDPATESEYDQNSPDYSEHPQTLTLMSAGDKVLLTNDDINDYFNLKATQSGYTNSEADQELLFQMLVDSSQTQLQTFTGYYFNKPLLQDNYITFPKNGYLRVAKTLNEIYQGTYYYGIKVLLTDYADKDILSNQRWVPIKITSLTVVPQDLTFSLDYSYTVKDQKMTITFPGYRFEPSDGGYDSIVETIYTAYYIDGSGNEKVLELVPGFEFDAKTLELKIQTNDNSLAGFYTIQFKMEIPTLEDSPDYYHIYASTSTEIYVNIEQFINTPMNMPPYFEESLPDVKLGCGDSYYYTFGEPLDQEEDEITMTVNLKATKQFAEYLQANNTLMIHPDNIQPHFEGEYEISVLLQDQYNTVEYSLALNITCQAEETGSDFKVNITDSEDEKKEKYTPSHLISHTVPRIDRISNIGVVYVLFNSTMIIDDNSTQMIESGTCNVTIDDAEVEKPVLEVNLIRKYYPDYEEEEGLYDFTWSVMEYDRDRLNLLFDFKAPYIISYHEIPDWIEITFWCVDVFIDQHQLPIVKDQVCSEELPTQISYATGQALVAASDSVRSSSETALISNFVLNIFLNASLAQILNAIKSLQLIVHMHMINVRKPANASIFNGALASITQFDIVPTDPMNDAIFDFKPEIEMSSSFEDLGYETEFFIKNIGSIFLVMLSIPILLATFKLCTKQSRSRKCRKWGETSLQNFFWNGFISFIYESYLLLAICTFINLQSLKWDSGGEKFNSGLSVFFLIVIIFFPIFVLLFYGYYSWLYNDKKFKEKYGVIMTNLNFKRLGSYVVIFPFASLLRRCLYSIIIVYLGYYSNFQLLSINFITIAMIIVIGQISPYILHFYTKVELFNECTILLINYHLFCFTDFVEPTALTYVGFSSIFIICANMIVNIGIALGTSILASIRRCRLNCEKKKKIKLMKQYKERARQIEMQLKEMEQQEERAQEEQKASQAHRDHLQKEQDRLQGLQLQNQVREDYYKTNSQNQETKGKAKTDNKKGNQAKKTTKSKTQTNKKKSKFSFKKIKKFFTKKQSKKQPATEPAANAKNKKSKTQQQIENKLQVEDYKDYFDPIPPVIDLNKLPNTKNPQQKQGSEKASKSRSVKAPKIPKSNKRQKSEKALTKPSQRLEPVKNISAQLDHLPFSASNTPAKVTQQPRQESDAASHSVQMKTSETKVYDFSNSLLLREYSSIVSHKQPSQVDPIPEESKEPNELSELSECKEFDLDNYIDPYANAVDLVGNPEAQARCIAEYEQRKKELSQK